MVRFSTLSLLLFLLWPPLAWLAVLVTAWIAYFFRDPARVTPLREGLVVAPADGLLAAKGSLYITRPTMMTYTAKRDDLMTGAADLFDVVHSGDVKIEVRKFDLLSDPIPPPVSGVPIGWCIRAQGSAPSRGDGAASDTLTAREAEILALMAEGRSNGEIGKMLFISTKTVSVHVSNILGKLGVASRTEAAAVARRRHLLP